MKICSQLSALFTTEEPLQGTKTPWLHLSFLLAPQIALGSFHTWSGLLKRFSEFLS